MLIQPHIGFASVDTLVHWLFLNAGTCYCCVLQQCEENAVETDVNKVSPCSVCRPTAHTLARQRLTAHAPGLPAGSVTDDDDRRQQAKQYWPMGQQKGKGFPYSVLSVGPRADPGVQAVSQQVTISHPHGGRLPLLSARPTVTFPDTEHHRPLAGTNLCCMVTDAHGCERLARGCYIALPQAGYEPTTC